MNNKEKEILGLLWQMGLEAVIVWCHFDPQKVNEVLAKLRAPALSFEEINSIAQEIKSRPYRKKSQHSVLTK